MKCYERALKYTTAGRGSFEAHLSLLVADCKVLATAVRWRKDAHGNTTQHMRADELADGLSLVTTVVHPDIFKSPFLRA